MSLPNANSSWLVCEWRLFIDDACPYDDKIQTLIEFTLWYSVVASIISGAIIIFRLFVQKYKIRQRNSLNPTEFLIITVFFYQIGIYYCHYSRSFLFYDFEVN